MALVNKSEDGGDTRKPEFKPKIGSPIPAKRKLVKTMMVVFMGQLLASPVTNKKKLAKDQSSST